MLRKIKVVATTKIGGARETKLQCLEDSLRFPARIGQIRLIRHFVVRRFFKIEGNTYDDVLVVFVVTGIQVLVANPT